MTSHENPVFWKLYQNMNVNLIPQRIYAHMQKKCTDTLAQGPQYNTDVTCQPEIVLTVTCYMHAYKLYRIRACFVLSLPDDRCLLLSPHSWIWRATHDSYKNMNKMCYKYICYENTSYWLVENTSCTVTLHILTFCHPYQSWMANSAAEAMHC